MKRYLPPSNLLLFLMPPGGHKQPGVSLSPCLWPRGEQVLAPGRKKAKPDAFWLEHFCCTCCGAVQAVQAARAAYTFALFLIQGGRTAFLLAARACLPLCCSLDL